MELLRDLENFQRLLAYRAMRNNLRTGAYASLVFGAFALWQGVIHAADSLLAIPLAGLGLLLLFDGIWLLKFASPIAFVVDGAVLTILGLWNIGLSVLGAAFGKQPGFFLLFGIFQVYIGVKRAVLYNRYKPLTGFQPDKQTMEELDKLIASVARVDFKTQPKAFCFFMNVNVNGMLFDDAALMVASGERFILAVPKNELAVRSLGDTTDAKAVQGEMSFGSSTVNIRIAPEYVDLIQRWRGVF